MSPHPRIILLCYVVVLLLISACSDRGSNAVSNPVVEARAAELLESIKAEDYARTSAQYQEGFFRSHTQEAWVDELKQLAAERGPMQAYHLRRSQSDTRFSGKFYILEYEAVHDGNKRVHHLITFLAPVEGGDIQLVGHKMTPWEASGTAGQ